MSSWKFAIVRPLIWLAAIATPAIVYIFNLVDWWLAR